MKNGLLILMFALAGFAVFANYNHDGGKKNKKAKGKKECCAAAHASASADGTVPACCSKMKAEGKSCSKEQGKSAEAKPACTGHGHSTEAAPKAQ